MADRTTTRCVRCGYDLRGHAAGAAACPECGEPDAARAPRDLHPVPDVLKFLVVTVASMFVVGGAVFIGGLCGHRSNPRLTSVVSAVYALGLQLLLGAAAFLIVALLTGIGAKASAEATHRHRFDLQVSAVVMLGVAPMVAVLVALAT